MGAGDSMMDIARAEKIVPD